MPSGGSRWRLARAGAVSCAPFAVRRTSACLGDEDGHGTVCVRLIGDELTAARRDRAYDRQRGYPAPVPRSRSSQAPPALHELESEIMEHIWRQGGETSVREVTEALNRKAEPARAYTTYMTVMRRLNDKGLLDRRRRGRRDTYVPRLTREQYEHRRAGAEVRALVERFGDVALAHFALALAGLNPARRRALERLAAGK